MSRLKVLGIAITTVRFVFEGFVAELKAECRIMLKCIFDVNTESQRSKHAFQGQMSYGNTLCIVYLRGICGTLNRMPKKRIMINVFLTSF